MPNIEHDDQGLPYRDVEIECGECGYRWPEMIYLDENGEDEDAPLTECPECGEGDAEVRDHAR